MNPFFGQSVDVTALAAHSERLDVRSPGEFAIDHIPDARNAPVLDDAERARVGTLHNQVSAFEARRAGAALVSRNIATILETIAAGKPRDWSPLVYCWRGGQRSRSLTMVLNEIGFRARQLTGGYRAYRRHVAAALLTLPAQFRYHVLCGLTGTGKSRLLEALAHTDAQVLDLEALAGHRGSLLGDDPNVPQPSQKRFESRLHATLAAFDPARPVFVEGESQRIGVLQVPPVLLDAMRRASCLRIETPLAERVTLLVEDYRHWCADTAALDARLAPLAPLVGRQALARWHDLATAGDFATLVTELLAQHYDPAYRRAIARNFPRIGDARVVDVASVARDAMAELARNLAAEARATPVAPVAH